MWRFGWSPDSRSIAVLASASPLAEGQKYSITEYAQPLDHIQRVLDWYKRW